MSRVSMNFRISPTAKDSIDALASDYGLTRSQVIRAMFSVAFKHIDEVRRVLAPASHTS